MRQFDVYASPSTRFGDIVPYVVVLQSHFLDGLPSVVAAPLLRADVAERFPYLSIDVDVGGDGFVTPIDVRALRQIRGNLAAYEVQINRGLQRLFTGF